MKHKVILKDGTNGEVDCNYDDAPNAAFKKYGDEWKEIIAPRDTTEVIK